MKIIQSSFSARPYDYDDYMALEAVARTWGAVARTEFRLSGGEMYVIYFANGVEFSAPTARACYDAARTYAETTKRLTGAYPHDRTSNPTD